MTYSPESRMLYVAPSSFTSLSHDRYLISRGHRELIVDCLPYEAKACALKRTHAILSDIYNTKNKDQPKDFTFKIHDITAGKVNISLNFSNSLSSYESIRDLIGRIQSIAEEKQFFRIQKCVVGPKHEIRDHLKEILKKMVSDPRTSPETRALIGTNAHLLNFSVTKKPFRDKIPPWTLSLDFTNTPLNHCEIQYFLWNIFYIPSHMLEFDVGILNFTNSGIHFFELFGGKPNQQYPEIIGEQIIVLLKRSLTALNLNHCQIGHEILKPLSQFQNLKSIHLSHCKQNREQPITPLDILKALTNCTHLQTLNINKWKFNSL
jgi:hypothetical protein